MFDLDYEDDTTSFYTPDNDDLLDAMKFFETSTPGDKTPKPNELKGGR